VLKAVDEARDAEAASATEGMESGRMMIILLLFLQKQSLGLIRSQVVLPTPFDNLAAPIVKTHSKGA